MSALYGAEGRVTTVEKQALLGMLPEELALLFKDWGEPAFRSGQVFSWLHKGASFSEMTNLPKTLRERLERDASIGGASISRSVRSAIDGTEKFLFLLEDGNIVEGVLMEYNYGLSLCISTQVGCRMGCAFCASTVDGLVRNLTAGEIVGQAVSANRYALEKRGQGISHIVLMGSGEPLENLTEVLRFFRLVNHEKGLHLGLRNISISTCGLVPGIYQLAKERLGVTLSISLHAPNDTVRRTIMPVARAYPYNELMQAARDYVQQTGRRVVFEYLLADGVNDRPEHARELASHLRGWQNHVNLIPLNAVKESLLQPSRSGDAFMKELERLGVSVTKRRTMGEDIDSACGQLRRRYMDQMQKGESV